LKGMQTIRRNSNGNVTPLVSTLVGKMSWTILLWFFTND
jgi:hypothetical protein